MDNSKDTYKHKGMRNQLVELIRSKGITDETVLKAIGNVPRHLFMESSFIGFAYSDNAFPIGNGQTISQPSTVAFQSQLLQVKKGDRILEVGTGSGYQAAVLIEMGAKIFTIERQKALYDKTKKFLPSINYNPRFFFGDGFAGLPTFAPFDKVIITCGAPFIPDALVEQLKPGGIMVVPIGSGEIQVMTTLEKDTNNKITKKEWGNFRFVPMLSDKERS